MQNRTPSSRIHPRKGGSSCNTKPQRLPLVLSNPGPRRAAVKRALEFVKRNSPSMRFLQRTTKRLSQSLSMEAMEELNRAHRFLCAYKAYMSSVNDDDALYDFIQQLRGNPLLRGGRNRNSLSALVLNIRSDGFRRRVSDRASKITVEPKRALLPEPSREP